MKWIGIEEIQAVEEKAFKQRGLSSFLAMSRAGAAVAGIVEDVARHTGITSIVVIAGTGNNGGDGFIAARCLVEDGYQVKVIMTCVPANLRGDARRAWESLHNAGIPYQVCASESTWTDDYALESSIYPRRAIIVDALLGIGAYGHIRPTIAAAINWINAVSPRCLIVSVDVPSGLDGRTGLPLEIAVKALLTVTFTRPKIGFANPVAQAYLGHLHVQSIGIPNDLVEGYECDGPHDVELLTYPEMRPFIFATRPLDCNKKTFGHALIFGGSENYPHAPVLASIGALRAGAGLVTLCIPENACAAAGALIPEAILEVRHLNDTELRKPFLESLYAGRYSVAGIGPGLGRSEYVHNMVEQFIQKTGDLRIVVDADALYYLAKIYANGWKPDPTRMRIILTPHPGEAATLLDTTTVAIQADRPAAVRAIAKKYHAVVVLKGMRTLIATPEGRVWMSVGGNPGMATAGMGDALTGIITGLLARGMGAQDAALFGVYKHAMAGDLAASHRGQETLITSDLLAAL